MLSERLARWQFWLLFIGFILTFGPMHIAGMLGMPRRIYTYDADRGWDIWNQLTTIGAFIQVPSYAIFVYNIDRVAVAGQAGRATTPGTPGRWNGRRPRRRRPITSSDSRPSIAVGRSGI